MTYTFHRKDFLELFSKELIELLKKHEPFYTMSKGKNLFLLHTPNSSYKIIIEKKEKKIGN